MVPKKVRSDFSDRLSAELGFLSLPLARAPWPGAPQGRRRRRVFTRSGITDASAAPTLLGLDKNSALIYHGDPALTVTYLDSDDDELRAQPADVKPRTRLPRPRLLMTSPLMTSLPSSSLPMSRLLTTSPLMQACRRQVSEDKPAVDKDAEA